MKNIILISLILLITSKYTMIEFGKDTLFDKDNTEFEFTFENSGILLIYVTSDSSNNIKFYLFEDEHQIIINPIVKPGFGSMIRVNNTYSYKIKFEYTNPNSNDKGIIWINPLYNKIKVNLNETYIGKFDLQSINTGEDKLIYVVNNAEKTVTFKFNYSEKMIIDSKEIQIYNPFEICGREDCFTDITTFEFQQGESYNIIIYINKVRHGSTDYCYYLPAFSFYDKDKEGTNNSKFNLALSIWFISILLLIL